MPAHYSRFRSSRCRRVSQPSEFIIDCESQSDAADRVRRVGQCDRPQMCIDTMQNGIQQAWCTSERTFVETLPTQATNRVLESIVHGANQRGREAIEVILTTSQRQVFYAAFQISLAASDANGNILVPPTTCTSCSSLGFSRTPQGTAQFEVHVIMRKADDTADIHGFVWRTAGSRGLTTVI